MSVTDCSLLHLQPHEKQQIIKGADAPVSLKLREEEWVPDTFDVMIYALNFLAVKDVSLDPIIQRPPMKRCKHLLTLVKKSKILNLEETVVMVFL